MKKLTHLIAIVLVAGTFTSCKKDASPGPAQQNFFMKYYGDAYADQGVKVKPAGDGYVICGSTSDVNGTKSSYLVKTDKYGNMQWDVAIPSSTGEVEDDAIANDVVVLGQDYVIVGTAEDSALTSIQISRISGVTGTGVVVWSKEIQDTIAGVSWQGNGLVATTAGGFAIVGTTDARRTSTSGGLTKVLNEFGTDDMLWVETDAQGTVSSFNAYGGTNVDIGNDIVSISGNRYALLGTSSSFSEPGQENSQNVFLVEINEVGALIDEITYGESDEDFGHSITVLPDNSYAICGTTSFTNGTTSMLVVRTSANNIHGTVETYFLNGSGVAEGFEVKATDDGGLIACGLTGATSAQSDAFLVKLTSDGSVEESAGGWTRTFGDAGDEAGRSVLATEDGGYAMAGNTSLQGTSMVSLIKVNSAGEIAVDSE